MRLALFATVVTQAFMASYFAVRGLSLLFGGFPSESEWVEAATGGNDVKLNSDFYIYLSLLVVLTVLGVKHKYDSEDEDEDNKKEG